VTGRLAGNAVVVTDADSPRGADAARTLAAEGATLVCCGADAGALGALASELGARGARVAVFVGDPNDPALAEMVAELFGKRAGAES
jgi:NADP-dependent 3-hydroxy acid dehydrogenase YdfG